VELSVIIVNYNVKHFLEQCLYAVQKAAERVSAEIIVIDNNSSDGSVEYLEPLFPAVQWISNKENTGFGRACNQGLRLSKGKYVLFLNPDTILPENCFRQCISFLEEHPGAGALGVKMLDGAGKFLKESKRSFPSPSTSLFKLIGLSKLFPRSKIFARYYLGHLDENSNHEVEVLAGAFMMVKREVLKKTGGFDEAFFMYGEDVDLSYRIHRAGYKNFYYAGCSIIHFKGESSRKRSINYVRMFYTAMSIFVRKHYSGSRAGVYNFLLHAGIWSRAVLTAMGNFIRRIGLPVMDAGLILLSFWLMKTIWNNYFRTDVLYENKLLWIAFPIYTVIYLLVAWYAGLYDRQYRRVSTGQATLIATIVLLAGYAMLPEQYRFSRAIILFGALLAFTFISLLRVVMTQAGVLQQAGNRNEHPGTLVVAAPEEYENIIRLIRQAGLKEKILGRVSVDENDTTGVGFYEKITQIQQFIPFREVVYCRGKLSFTEIINNYQQLPAGIKIKFHAAGSGSIVGSDSRHSTGDILSAANGHNLNDPYKKRLKRLIDVSVALLAILTFPVQLFLVKKPFHFFRNCLTVLLAKKTWVGYAVEEIKLPPLRKGIIACNGVPLSALQQLPEENLRLVDQMYAADYEPIQDLKLLLKFYKKLGG
jgi:GT2 family glycosyltransferase